MILIHIKNFNRLKLIDLFERLLEYQDFHYAFYEIFRSKSVMIRNELKFIRLKIFSYVISACQFEGLSILVSLLNGGRKYLVYLILEAEPDDLRNLTSFY